MLVHKDTQIQKDKDARETLRQKHRLLQSACLVQASEVERLRQLAADVYPQVMYRLGIRNVTPLGKYTLAVVANVSNVGRKAAIEMLGGREINGLLKSADILTSAEHRFAVAQRIFASDHRAAIEANFTEAVNDAIVLDGPAPDEDVRARAADLPKIYKPLAVTCVEFKGDATKQEAVQREKMFLSTMRKVTLEPEAYRHCLGADVEEEFDVDSFQTLLQERKDFPAMQSVSAGTAQEVYRIVSKQYSSVGEPSWEDAVNHGADVFRRASEPRLSDRNGWHLLIPVLVRLYLFTLDRGSDNRAFIRRVKERLKGTPWLMLVCAWCRFHIYHCIVKLILCALDLWVWDLGELPVEIQEAWALPTKYFSATATIGNTCRDTGMPRKIKAKAVSLWPNDPDYTIVEKEFSTVPGRCLRGRWGSEEGVALKIKRRIPYLGTIFKLLFSKELDKAAKKKTKAPGAEEDVKWEEDRKTFRLNATKSLNSPLYAVMNCVSVVGKGPLAHFLLGAKTMQRD